MARPSGGGNRPPRRRMSPVASRQADSVGTWTTASTASPRIQPSEAGAGDETARRERMQALSRMASGVVHDFNNLLAPILGFADLLLSFPSMLDQSATVASYLERIRAAARRSARVVDRLRECYRSRDGTVEPARCSVVEAVEESLALTAPLWSEPEAGAPRRRRIGLALELEPTAPIVAHAADIRQALTDIILNAIESMPEGGTLRLRTFTIEGRVCVQIADTGTGMAETMRARCFEPFFTTKQEPGRGLGLAIVYGIVERHHGSIDLQSEPGCGTVVTMSFPPASRRPESALAESSPRSHGGVPHDF